MKNDMNEIRFAKILIREGNVIAVSHGDKGCVVLSILVGNTDFYGMTIKYDPEHRDIRWNPRSCTIQRISDNI